MSASPPTAVVLHGALAPDAPADEQDVLHEAAAVEHALHALGYRVQRQALTLNLAHARERLVALAPALVFNLVESVAGSGRLIGLAPLLLEELGLLFTGAPAGAMLLSSNKLLAKSLLRAHGIATPAWDPHGAPPARGPWIVKSVWEHASIGLDDASVVDDADSIALRLADRRRALGGEWFAEQFIEGREFNLSVLEGSDGPAVLPAAEIVFDGFPAGKPRIVGYRAKWDPDAFEFHHTPRRFTGGRDVALTGALSDIALHCWRLFGLRGYARVDFRVDAHGTPWVLEVNANPCLTPDAGFMAAAARAGLDPAGVVARIVASAARPADARDHGDEDRHLMPAAPPRHSPCF